MNADPFDGLARLTVFFCLGIPACCGVNFLNFGSAVYFGSVFFYQFRTLAIFIDGHVTVHTNIHRRHVGVTTFKGAAMAIQTANLVSAGMYFMGIEYGLLRLVVFIAAKADGTLNGVVAANYKQHYSKSGDIGLIAIERHRLVGRNAFFVVRQFAEIAVYL